MALSKQHILIFLISTVIIIPLSILLGLRLKVQEEGTCSPTNLDGTCCNNLDGSCSLGKCVYPGYCEGEWCTVANPSGICPAKTIAGVDVGRGDCIAGVCGLPWGQCSISNMSGMCESDFFSKFF